MKMKNWEQIIESEKTKPYFVSLKNFLDLEYDRGHIYPSKENLFNCFRLTPYDKVKVVIIGQDPYHQKGQAHGLAFSILDNHKIAPSLRNIFKELKTDLQIERKERTDLTMWATQGVLLLNKVLSVEDSKPTSHSSIGWQIFTNNIIKELDKLEKPIIYVLWGNDAQAAKKYITNKNHYMIESSHPSPLSAYHSFNGSKPFSKINTILKSHGIEVIDWSL